MIRPPPPDARAQGQRLRLRRLDSGDEAFYRALYGDALVMRWIGSVLTPRQAARSFSIALAQTIGQDPTAIAPGPEPSDGPEPLADPFLDLPWSRKGAASALLPLRFVAETRAEGQEVALLAADRWDAAGRDWELGVMVPRDRWGLGYARDALAALVQRLFSAGARRLLMRSQEGNTRLSRLALGLGFQSRAGGGTRGAGVQWARLRDGAVALTQSEGKAA